MVVNWPVGYGTDANHVQIEIVVGAALAANVIPQPKSLAERATQPKAQPKSAASDKHGAAAKKTGRAATRGRGGRRGTARSARPAKKTAEELDSEMADYFVDSANGNNGASAQQPAAAPAPANTDEQMDEGGIMVCCSPYACVE